MALKYDYSPDKHTLFTAIFRMTPFFNKRRTLAETHDTYLGDYDYRNMAKNTDLTPSLDLFFKREFDSRNTLEIQVVGLYHIQ